MVTRSLRSLKSATVTTGTPAGSTVVASRIQRIVIREQIGAGVRADLPATPGANRRGRWYRLLSSCAERRAATLTLGKGTGIPALLPYIAMGYPA